MAGQSRAGQDRAGQGLVSKGPCVSFSFLLPFQGARAPFFLFSCYGRRPAGVLRACAFNYMYSNRKVTYKIASGRLATRELG